MVFRLGAAFKQLPKYIWNRTVKGMSTDQAMRAGAPDVPGIDEDSRQEARRRARRDNRSHAARLQGEYGMLPPHLQTQYNMLRGNSSSSYLGDFLNSNLQYRLRDIERRHAGTPTAEYANDLERYLYYPEDDELPDSEVEKINKKYHNVERTSYSDGPQDMNFVWSYDLPNRKDVYRKHLEALRPK